MGHLFVKSARVHMDDNVLMLSTLLTRQSNINNYTLVHPNTQTEQRYRNVVRSDEMLELLCHASRLEVACEESAYIVLRQTFRIVLPMQSPGCALCGNVFTVYEPRMRYRWEEQEVCVHSRCRASQVVL